MLGATLVSSAAAGLFIGDNGGRPRALPRSSLFELAASRGIYNLPGSDPLPLGWEIRKPGSLGCMLEGPVDLSRPCEDIIGMLLKLRAQPLLFGDTESLPGFARSQVALRLAGRSAPAGQVEG